MKYLVVYKSLEGHTAKIARIAADRLMTAAGSVDVLDADVSTGELDPANYDGVVVAAPVHQRNHPETIISFVQAHRDDLNAKPTALISVSLSAAFADGLGDAQSYVDSFVADGGWTPTAVCLAAGALRYSEYDFFQEQIIRHVVLRDREVKDLGGDYDFTDWDALRHFVDGFAAQARERSG